MYQTRSMYHFSNHSHPSLFMHDGFPECNSCLVPEDLEDQKTYETQPVCLPQAAAIKSTTIGRKAFP